MTQHDSHWLQEAVGLAVDNVAVGGGPFAALVVRDGEVVASGVNRVTLDLDPTAHAEVSAIRAACRELGSFTLAGCELFTSCEPCPLCVAAALWARLDRVVFAADRHDAARGGFDDHHFYELMDVDPQQWPSPVVPLRVEDAARPFDAWLGKADRTHY
ncbi:nucleoside deaminase [Nocardioides solisilvae]|uniref:nucleoside deaminase n=1 Tax=Nocardioides solisilvae TaxID=1542435 RepID=UPI000D7477FB|nr:nucleoside deaminase [Nocardioides solisilvae]